MSKIIVIGCPGAGKSTFSRKLSEVTGIKLHYLDMLWHKPDKTHISREEFDIGLEKIMANESWIIDGNYTRTLGARLKECDTAFLLDYPLEICLEGAASRIGKERVDLPWTEDEFDEEFKQYIIEFSKDNLPVIYELLDKYRDTKKIIIFKSRNEADDYLENIK